MFALVEMDIYIYMYTHTYICCYGCPLLQAFTPTCRTDIMALKQGLPGAWELVASLLAGLPYHFAQAQPGPTKRGNWTEACLGNFRYGWTIPPPQTTPCWDPRGSKSGLVPHIAPQIGGSGLWELATKPFTPTTAGLSSTNTPGPPLIQEAAGDDKAALESRLRQGRALQAPTAALALSVAMALAVPPRKPPRKEMGIPPV